MYVESCSSKILITCPLFFDEAGFFFGIHDTDGLPVFIVTISTDESEIRLIRLYEAEIVILIPFLHEWQQVQSRVPFLFCHVNLLSEKTARTTDRESIAFMCEN